MPSSESLRTCPILGSVEDAELGRRHPGENRLPKLLIAAILGTNVGLAMVVQHVLRTRGYAAAGHLPEVLPWGLAISSVFAITVLGFARLAKWRAHLTGVFCGTVLATDFLFFLPRVLRLPTQQERLYMVGLVYAVFLFSLAALAVWYAWANAHSTSRRFLQMWVLGLTILVYVGTTGWVKLSSTVTGDEPHYLTLTYSLVHDHDFNLANNYAHRDYLEFYPFRLDPHTVPGRGSTVMLWHDIGLPLLMAPGYALAGRTGAMLILNIATAVLALGIFEAAIELGASAASAVMVWGLFGFSAPLMIYNSQVYPETAGAAGALWAVILFTRFIKADRRSYLWGTGVLLALVPWLSIRYWMYAGPLIVVITCFVVVRRGRMWKVQRLLALGFPLILSLLLFAGFDWVHFGTILPNAGYLRLAKSSPQYESVRPVVGILGLLFDRARGVIPIAPVFLWALAGFVPAWKKGRWPAVALLAASFSYLVFMACSQFWHGGWCPPARYSLGAAALWSPAAALVLGAGKRQLLLGAAVLWGAVSSLAYTAFPMMRYPELPRLATSGLDVLARNHTGFEPNAVFPSLVRNGPIDHYLAAVWLGLTALLVAALVLPELRAGRSKDSLGQTPIGGSAGAS